MIVSPKYLSDRMLKSIIDGNPCDKTDLIADAILEQLSRLRMTVTIIGSAIIIILSIHSLFAR